MKLNEMQVKKAADLLTAAAAHAVAAWKGINKGMTLAVLAGVGSEAVKTDTQTVGAVRKGLLMDWARKTINSDATFETVRVYVSMSAAVALVPDAVGEKTIGKGMKAAKTLINGATAIKTKADLNAVATAANKTLGIKTRGVPKKKTTDADKELATAKEELGKAKAELAKAPPLSEIGAVCSRVREILTSGSPSDREALALAVIEAGFILTAQTAKSLKKAKTLKGAKHERPAPVVNPAARKPGKRVGYGEHASK